MKVPVAFYLFRYMFIRFKRDEKLKKIILPCIIETDYKKKLKFRSG